MELRKITAGVGLAIACFSFQSFEGLHAQDIHFTQFNMAPLTVNPAFTGAFAGDFRVNAIYRDQWRSVIGKSAYRTYALSLDMPVIRDLAVDDYLAAGLQLYNDVAGDGNLSNFSALASVAYHKFLGLDGMKALTVGLQGGYVQKSIDLSRLHFGDEYIDGDWRYGTTSEELFNNTSHFLLNAGLAWSQAFSPKFSYVIGAGVNNVNQPLESYNRRKANSEVGLGMRYTGQIGAIVGINDRFSIRPAVLVQSQAKAMELVGGAEFHYKLGEDFTLPTTPAVFAGAWYRHQDAVMATVGIEWQSLRLGIAYDYNTSDLSNSSNGNGGFEIALRYIKPNALDFARKLIYPCGRF